MAVAVGIARHLAILRNLEVGHALDEVVRDLPNDLVDGRLEEAVVAALVVRLDAGDFFQATALAEVLRLPRVRDVRRIDVLDETRHAVEANDRLDQPTMLESCLRESRDFRALAFDRGSSEVLDGETAEDEENAEDQEDHQHGSVDRDSLVEVLDVVRDGRLGRLELRFAEGLRDQAAHRTRSPSL